MFTPVARNPEYHDNDPIYEEDPIYADDIEYSDEAEPYDSYMRPDESLPPAKKLEPPALPSAPIPEDNIYNDPVNSPIIKQISVKQLPTLSSTPDGDDIIAINPAAGQEYDTNQPSYNNLPEVLTGAQPPPEDDGDLHITFTTPDDQVYENNQT